MKRLNLGCGPDIKKGWLNADLIGNIEQGVVELDIRENIVPGCEFILVNHVLCTMTYFDVALALKNIYDSLVNGGVVQIIDMDLLKAFDAYKLQNIDLLPADGDIDERLCLHISGYSTRRSLFTNNYLKQLLMRIGFSEVNIKESSPYDLRPNESLIVEAIK